MSEHMHECRPGMVLDEVKFEKRMQPDGVTEYWSASQDVTHLFGSEVHGRLESYGATKELALENLKLQQGRLYESLWV